MKKDLEWLKDRVNQASLFTDDEGSAFGDSWVVSRNVVIGLIDRLDEPETLSKKWIDNHTASAYTIAHYSEEDVPVVTVSDLESLLVPKLDLPEIPDYVAEYIEDRKENSYPLYQAIRIVFENSRFIGTKLNKWLLSNKNQEIFLKAWVNGYTVEEKKYRVVLPLKDSMDNKMYLTTTNDGELDEEDLWFNTEVEKEHYSDNLFKYEFTKQEIKKINNGIYWPFAKEVTE